jgi:hypothetical protein
MKSMSIWLSKDKHQMERSDNKGDERNKNAGMTREIKHTSTKMLKV